MPLTVSTAVPNEAAGRAIRALAAVVERADGSPPLSDGALGALADADVVHVSAYTGPPPQLVGYAQRAGSSVEVVAELPWVDVLLDAALVPGSLVWTHGTHSRLVAPLEGRGVTRVRELHKLSRPLDADQLPPDPPLPAGVHIRSFEPGRDDDAWLAVNAAAFAEHREQGGWTRSDLRARMAEQWFDPAGFLLADRDGELLGFHWTKIAPDGSGEVYILGVAPTGQGMGLGNALLVRGLRHLAGQGCREVRLYVDGDNPVARRLYERAGFASADLDVQWALS